MQLTLKRMKRQLQKNRLQLQKKKKNFLNRKNITDRNLKRFLDFLHRKLKILLLRILKTKLNMMPRL